MIKKQKLQEESLQQEQNAKRVEQENKMIQQEVLKKQQERDMVMSTLPKLEYIPGANESRDPYTTLLQTQNPVI